jgi:acyl dehydratase
VSATVEDWVGRQLDAGPGDIEAERGYVIHWCEAVEDANPLYWDEATANEVTGGWTAPPSMLSVWMRPLMFNPHATQRVRPLELHFQLKDAFELPEGIVTGNEIEFGVPVRMGDVISTVQRVRDISDERTNRLGTGRAWTIDVEYTNQRGEIVGVETYRMFSYNRTSS